MLFVTVIKLRITPVQFVLEPYYLVFLLVFLETLPDSLNCKACQPENKVTFVARITIVYRA